MYSSQRSPSTGCMTSRNCGVFWMKIQTLSSDRNQRILSTEGRRASRAVMETRHLYCWSHCLSAEVDFLPSPSQMSIKERPSVNHFEAIKNFLLCSATAFIATLVPCMWHFQWLTDRLIMKQAPALNVTNQVFKFIPFICIYWLIFFLLSLSSM